MKHLLLLLFLVIPVFSASATHHIILCGGPASLRWEKLRVKKDQHDNWWANFNYASVLRAEEIYRAYDKSAKITWIVYRPGFQLRSRQDGKPYVKWIGENAAKRNIKLIWVDSGPAAIRAINNHPARSVMTFDYFGHSNRHCFMLDYGSDVMAVSQSWIHENNLGRLRKGIFNRNCISQSYGCHTGESMSQIWRQKLGHTLIGAKGKTDYAALNKGKLPVVNGTWVR